MKANGSPRGICVWGYVVKEDDIYTAICINFGLFVQAESPERAIKRILKLCGDHYTYIRKNHPQDWEKHLHQSLPKEFVNEYRQGMNEIIEALEKEKERIEQENLILRDRLRSRIQVLEMESPIIPNHMPTRTFAQEISST